MIYETKIATAVGTYTAVIEAADQGGYDVNFPAIAGLEARAETVEEAYIKAHECLRDHLAALRRARNELPVIQ
jgi:predicted RNase H-like HicB family nuclease